MRRGSQGKVHIAGHQRSSRDSGSTPSERALCGRPLTGHGRVAVDSGNPTCAKCISKQAGSGGVGTVVILVILAAIAFVALDHYRGGRANAAEIGRQK